MANKLWSVYVHTTPDGKKYVGMSTDPQKRWACGNGYRTKIFRDAIDFWGWDKIQHEIIHDKLSLKEAENLERELIQKYNTTNRDYGFNIESGGISCPLAEETKRKLSISHKGLQPWNAGKSLNQETKNKISEALKGKPKNPVSENTREKLRLSSTGRHHDKETKETLSTIHKGKKASLSTKVKMSNARKGVPKSEDHKKRIAMSRNGGLIYCVELNIVFNSIREASKTTGIGRTSISQCLNGEKDSINGFHWEKVCAI